MKTYDFVEVTLSHDVIDKGNSLGRTIYALRFLVIALMFSDLRRGKGVGVKHYTQPNQPHNGKQNFSF